MGNPFADPKVTRAAGLMEKHLAALFRWGSAQRVARRYASQTFQWTRSPLSYNVSGTAKRLGLIDSEAGDPNEGEVYFAETQKELRKKNYQRYKKRRFETVPGAEPGTVAFLDYHEFPNYYGDGKLYLYLDYVSTRGDRIGQGHARKLFEEMLRKHGKDSHYDFGRIAHKAVYKIFRDWQSRGINVRGKNWGGWTDEEVGLRSASAVRVVARFEKLRKTDRHTVYHGLLREYVHAVMTEQDPVRVAVSGDVMFGRYVGNGDPSDGQGSTLHLQRLRRLCVRWGHRHRHPRHGDGGPEESQVPPVRDRHP
jgi:hypothetical protein